MPPVTKLPAHPASSPSCRAAAAVARLNLRLASPRLWDGVRDPYLYRVVDSHRQKRRRGIGTARHPHLSHSIRPRGFLLNGRPYPLRGANLMHSARPGKGTAVTDAEIAEDFAILREMGSTGVRLVHFQHPRKAYDEADRLGLVAWTEIGINSEVEDTPEFRANAAQQMRELIAQNYNHPSVVMWGIGNEVYSEDPKVARMLRKLHDVAKLGRPGRPTVYAHCCQADDHPKAMVTDLIGFNRYFGWYPGREGHDRRMGRTLPRGASRARPFAVSEYGAGASILHQEDPPRPGGAGERLAPRAISRRSITRRTGSSLRTSPICGARFVWVAFDLASAGRNEGDRRGINDKGLVTYDRKTRKDAFYWYQANWSDRPMLHITSRRFILRPGPAVEVKAYTNAGPATLIVNGVSIGTQVPADHMLRWTATLRPGPNRIEVRSATGVSDRVEWIYQPQPEMLTH